METKVLSVRVPAQFAKELSTYCKQSKISVSEYMQKGFTNVGMMQLDEIRIEPEMEETIITVGGGSVVGILAYKGVKSILKNKKYTDKEIEVYSSLAGIVCGIITSIGINKIFKEIKS